MITLPDTRPATQRLHSIDVMRGLVMVLMAIDHVRVYSGLPAGGPTPGIFFTRWITHFCAPAFVFFAGTSAFLYGRALESSRPSRPDPRETLGRYLVARGMLLVLLELTVIRVAWTFNLDFAHYMLGGVIWMIGWCMILLAVLIHLRLPLGVIAIIGVAIVAGHNLLDSALPHLIPAARASSTFWLWQVLYFGPIAGSDGPFVVLYSLIPWIGVICVGYAFGAIATSEPRRRERVCLLYGSAAIAVFGVLRAAHLYGEPRPWNGTSVLSFLNTTKYPASLQFLLMTLGPTIALLPLAERARGRATGMLAVFGRVPLFYYLLHVPAIHAAALVVSFVRQGHVDPWLFTNHPMSNPPPPAGYTWSLSLLYLVFTAIVLGLYPLCRWFAGEKDKRRGSWIRYL
jgi:uncharacterized membrane protein